MGYWIAGVVFFILAVLFFGGTYWCFQKAFYMPTKYKKGDPHEFFGEERDRFCREPMLALVKELEARPYERVCIRSRDGLQLVGRFYPSPDSDRLEIFFHGWRGTALRDGCGGGRLARESGHNLLMVDQRAHGESDGHVITFGIKEKYDCLDWVNYAVERFGPEVKILLSGVSMGAATVLMASALPLPEQVKGISADCGYSSPEAIIRKVCRDMGISDRIGFPFIRVAARLYGGFSIKDGGAVDAVSRAKLPILLIHGDEDGFVPFFMSEQIYDACASERQLLRVPKAGHGLSFFYDYDAYVTTVRTFQARIWQ